MWTASVAFGRNTSVCGRSPRTPPFHRSDGSQLGSTEVVAPFARTRSKSAGRSGARRALEEIRSDVDVRGGCEELGVDGSRAKVSDRSLVGQDRAIVGAREHDGEPRRAIGCDDEPFHVHAPAVELVAHEATEEVVADDTAEGNAESEASGAARHDRPGAADREMGAVQEPLPLPERRLDVPRQHEVGVRVAEDQEVDAIRHGARPRIRRRPRSGGSSRRSESRLPLHPRLRLRRRRGADPTRSSARSPSRRRR